MQNNTKTLAKNKDGKIAFSNIETETVVTKCIRTTFTEMDIQKKITVVEKRTPGFKLVPLIGNKEHNIVVTHEILEFVKEKDNTDLALKCEATNIKTKKGNVIGVKIITPPGAKKFIQSWISEYGEVTRLFWNW